MRTLCAGAEKFAYGEVAKKPTVPTAAECTKARAAMSKAETKDFVTANAVENILSQPPRPAEAVDWTKKPSYGKVWTAHAAGY